MIPDTASTLMADFCNRAPVIPVLVVDNPAHARPLATALVKGGLPVLEVTLRTAAALDVIAEMTRVPGAIVGAGTVLSPDDVQAVRAAGAQFAVSPGSTDAMLEACMAAELPVLPGAATASEAMRLQERGYHMLKFFPAEAAGGAPMLKALGGPLPKICFCPTGGVSAANARSYLDLPNVPCCGGSWIAPKELVEARDWDAIAARAVQASAL